MESKPFNKSSRELFSRLCSVKECGENGKPTQAYVRHKLAEACLNLFSDTLEIKSQLQAVEKEGSRAWSREFAIDDTQYTVKFLDKLGGEFNLPAGHVAVENDKDAALLTIDQFVSDRKIDLGKFWSEFNKAGSEDITDEYVSDLRSSVAQTLMPLHAAAADEAAFKKMLALIGQYEPNVYGVLMDNFKSLEGLSKVIEQQAESALEKKIIRCEEMQTLDDIIYLPTYSINARRAVAALVTYVMSAAGAAAISAHDNSEHPQESHDYSRYAQGIQKPTFELSGKEPCLPCTPINLTNPPAGLDYYVCSNHEHGIEDQTQFLTKSGQCIVFTSEANGPNNEHYKEYWLYYTDNPVYVIAPGFRDHHGNDFEVVVDKYTSDGQFVERAMSYHVKLNGHSFERGWRFTNDPTLPIKVELAGHAMSTNDKDFFNPFCIIAKDPIYDEIFYPADPIRDENLYPAFHHEKQNGRVLKPGDYVEVDLSVLPNEPFSSLYMVDQYDRYMVDTRFEIPKSFGDASKVPWHTEDYSKPWKIFDNKDSTISKYWQSLIEGKDIEARLVAQGSRIVMGEENGVPKADNYGTYVKSGDQIFIASDFSNYGVVQLEIQAKADTHYKVRQVFSNLENGQTVPLEKSYEMDIKKGEVQAITIDSAPRTIRSGSGAADYLLPAAIGGLAAAGAAYFLYSRYKSAKAKVESKTTLEEPNAKKDSDKEA